MESKRLPERLVWLVHIICFCLLLAVGYTWYRISGPEAAAGDVVELPHLSRLKQMLETMNILLVMGMLISFALLVVAGRKEMAGIDLWYTEVTAAGIVLAGMVGYWGILQLDYGFAARSAMDVLTGFVLCSLMYFPILLLLLSLSRKIRNHRFLSDFLCVRAFFGVVDSYEHRNDRLKSGLSGMLTVTFLLVDGGLAFSAGAAAVQHRPWQAAVLASACLFCNALFLVTVSVRAKQLNRIFERIVAMTDGNVGTSLDSAGMHGDILQMAKTVNELDRSLENAVRERTSSERMKADLIANVSHDLRTPLTSIISYVDLLKRERIPNPRAQEYLSVLEDKSMRLKKMAETLMEATRASSGNMKITWEEIDMVQMIRQVYGEFQEKMEERGLIPLIRLIDPPALIRADGEILWRVLDNLYTNVCKYGRPGTQVLIELQETAHSLVYTMKNVSDAPLRYSSEELMERFTRGEDSRTTEGNGLGLSIARSMTEQLNGRFELYSDEEIFRVRLVFPLAKMTDSGDLRGNP